MTVPSTIRGTGDFATVNAYHRPFVIRHAHSVEDNYPVHGNGEPYTHGHCDNLYEMENLYARTVFFVKDAEEALNFYTHTLGFALDWNHQYEGRAWVFQVSLFGFELILNQVHGPTQIRCGHGRIFIGLEDDQATPMLQHIRHRGLKAMRVEWGRPTLVLLDPDGNELFFWIPDSEWANLTDLPPLYS